MSTKQTKPLPDDNDSKRITAQLNIGASAFDISQEAHRLCSINAPCARISRNSKQKQAVMEDALSEMRAELSPTQTLLDRLWQVMPMEDLRQDLKNQYAALRYGDPFDCKPTYRQPKLRVRRDTRRSIKEQKKQYHSDKHTRVAGPGKTTSLLHTYDIKAYDMVSSKGVDCNDDEDDGKGEGEGEGEDYKGNEGHEHSNITHVNITPSTGVQPSDAASTDTVTDGKRKAVEQNGNVAKKVKLNSDSSIAGVVIARPIADLKRKRATETVDTALEKQNVGRVEGRDAASGSVDDDLEEGEIREFRSQ